MEDVIYISGKSPNKIRLEFLHLKQGEKMFVTDKEWYKNYKSLPSQVFNKLAKTHKAVRGNEIGFELIKL